MKKEEMLKLNIQFFADDTQSDDEGNEENITLSNDELQKRIESESDKKLAKVLSKKEQEWQSKLDELVQEKLDNEKKLSKLSEAERKQKLLDQREAQIAEREKEIARSVVRSDVMSELSKRGLNTELSKFITDEDEEEALLQINELNKLIDEAKNEAVKHATRQETPRNGSTLFGTSNNNGKSFVEMANENRLIK